METCFFLESMHFEVFGSFEHKGDVGIGFVGYQTDLFLFQKRAESNGIDTRISCSGLHNYGRCFLKTDD